MPQREFGGTLGPFPSHPATGCFHSSTAFWQSLNCGAGRLPPSQCQGHGLVGGFGARTWSAHLRPLVSALQTIGSRIYETASKTIKDW